MKRMQVVVLVAAVAGFFTPALAAKQMSDREKLRQQAEHDSYGDAQKLCSDAIPDESKVQACMTSKRAQLSPACKKVFNEADKT